MKPGQLATIDRARAADATRDITKHIASILAEDHPAITGDSMPLRCPEVWSAEARDVWKRMVWLWQCAVTGRDPADRTTPMTSDELALLRLELL